MTRLPFLPSLPRPAVWSRLARTLPPAERIETLASDGQRLALYRVAPEGKPKGAVLLLHGLCANRFAFHWPGRSVAQYLAARGFDAYVGELRGAGDLPTVKPTWNFDEYLELDVPAMLEAVRGHSGFARVHFIGHSMGGILLMCHALTAGTTGLASGTALASALTYGGGGSGFAPLQRLEPVLTRIATIPYGAAIGLVAPALGLTSDPISRFNFHPDNAEPELVRAVHANVFTRLPTALLQSLASALQPGGLKTRSGNSYLSFASSFQLPMLLASASDDRQCPREGLEETGRALSAKVLHFGAAHGHRAEYGHFDLLLGRNAPDEVWPELARWLSAS